MRRKYRSCGIIMQCACILWCWATPGWAEEKPPAPAPVAVKEKKFTSLFFATSELETIAAAREGYTTGVGAPEESGSDLLDQVMGIGGGKKSKEEAQEKYYEQFYLESLIYHTPGDWMVWLKSSNTRKKFTPVFLEAQDIRIKILQINKEDVMLEWTPKHWAQVSKAFQAGNPSVVLNESKRIVVFRLRVNQTLSSHDMQLVEGVVQPVMMQVDKMPVAAGAVQKLPTSLPNDHKDSAASEKPVEDKNPPASERPALF